MRILFVMRNHGYLRNYASAIRLLASQGHEVIVGSRGPERHMAVDTAQYLLDLGAEFPNVTARILPRRRDEWMPFAAALRAGRDALRYRHPSLRHATKLIDRADRHLAQRGPRLRRLLPGSWSAARLVSSVLAAAEAVVPTDPEIDDLVETIAPHAMVVTPLVDFNSYQVDYVKTAKRLGIPVALAVASWDNLTNKGRLAVQPDRVFVWNHYQLREAVELHGVAAARVVVTGAPLFDEWFERTPASTREAFCRRVGLDPGRPFLLYLCSSLFIAPDEVAFLRTWLAELRARGGALGGCGVLVRPHPGNAAPWKEVDLSAFGNAGVWPRQGAMPLESDTRADYFDSLHHSAGVVGINTTGLIEAGIVGRRSFTLLAPEFAETQGGTVHFEYLAGSGFLTLARTFDEHHAQLGVELERPSTRADFAAFIRDFVRPGGLDHPATPVLARAIEILGRETVAPMQTSRLQRTMRRMARKMFIDGDSSDRKAAAAANFERR
jgi:hypothetical protein